MKSVVLLPCGGVGAKYWRDHFYRFSCLPFTVQPPGVTVTSKAWMQVGDYKMSGVDLQSCFFLFFFTTN